MTTDRGNESLSVSENVVLKTYITPDVQSYNEYGSGFVAFLPQDADDLFDWLRLFIQESLGRNDTKMLEDEIVDTIGHFSQNACNFSTQHKY